MCGRDTLAIAVSSSSMNVAMVTVIAIIRGFMATRGAGRLKAAAVGVSVSLMGYRCLDADATVRSHTTMQGCHKRLLGRKPRQATASEGFSASVGGNCRQASSAAINFPSDVLGRILVQEFPVLARSCERLEVSCFGQS